ncbi:MAG: phosphonate ABC transporter, permease protein PhnE [Spirochaetia bacterium]|jgi:phosphonate transport system permease protein|nr:phosphonate ABC transporter, permease protein PhnE [Spirochaetia bacterium]
MTEIQPTIWKRFSRKQSLERYGIEFVLLLIFIWATRSIDIYWPFVTDAPTQAADLLNRMTPPNIVFIKRIVPSMIETINIATLSTIFAVILSFPLAILNARNTTPHYVVQLIARVIIVTSRSVNELVWGLIFVVFFGPGVIAGVAALTMRSLGFMAKLVSEAIEEIDRGQVEAIRATGANGAKVFTYGVLPQVLPIIIGTSIFRWDINIRQSAVIGLVGAGGIGILLTSSMNMFKWQNVSMILISIFVVVLAGEYVSATVRKKLV